MEKAGGFKRSGDGAAQEGGKQLAGFSVFPIAVNVPNAIGGAFGVKGEGSVGNLECAIDHVGLPGACDKTSGSFMSAGVGRLKHDVELYGCINVMQERRGFRQIDDCLKRNVSQNNPA